jgi:REP element-mobilizing transposase RayT
MTRPRASQVSLADTPYYHCVARCVRRAYLCGIDHLTGENYEHRREWLVTKMKSLASIFSIDICAYAVMSNHYHLILRVDTDTASTWSEQEVIDRWTRLFSTPVLVERYLRGQNNDQAADNKAREIIEQWRTRLTDISWFMRVLNESIARQANREDNCTGRFWEGRFRSQALLDDAAILACMAYVDLNPIRAGMAETPEESDFTSIQERLRAFAFAAAHQTDNAESVDPSTEQPADLLPFTGGEHLDAPKGIAFTLPDYLQLVDWTGRAVRDDKRGAIPTHIQPIFQRMGLNHEEWLEMVQNFGRRYRLAAGAVDRLRAFSQQLGRYWLQGIGASQRFYQREPDSLRV